MIASIRQQKFTLSKEVKYALLYRIQLLKIAREKSALRPLITAAFLSGLSSLVSFEIAYIAGQENYQRVANLSGKLGVGLVALAGLLYLIDMKIKQPPIDLQQDLVDTIQKAHESAQSLISFI